MLSAQTHMAGMLLGCTLAGQCRPAKVAPAVLDGGHGLLALAAQQVCSPVHVVCVQPVVVQAQRVRQVVHRVVPAAGHENHGASPLRVRIVSALPARLGAASDGGPVCGRCCPAGLLHMATPVSRSAGQQQQAQLPVAMPAGSLLGPGHMQAWATPALPGNRAPRIVWGPGMQSHGQHSMSGGQPEPALA